MILIILPREIMIIELKKKPFTHDGTGLIKPCEITQGDICERDTMTYFTCDCKCLIFCFDVDTSQYVSVCTHTYRESVPEKEFDVDYGWGYFLHHIGYEVELVTWTGSM